MNATEFTTKAANLVSGDRNSTHGDKHRNFANIAAFWNAYLEAKDGDPLTAADVGYMMGLLKIARTHSGAFNPDDIIDGIGYLACAGEIASK